MSTVFDFPPPGEEQRIRRVVTYGAKKRLHEKQRPIPAAEHRLPAARKTGSLKSSPAKSVTSSQTSANVFDFPESDDKSVTPKPTRSKTLHESARGSSTSPQKSTRRLDNANASPVRQYDAINAPRSGDKRKRPIAHRDAHPHSNKHISPSRSQPSVKSTASAATAKSKSALGVLGRQTKPLTTSPMKRNHNTAQDDSSIESMRSPMRTPPWQHTSSRSPKLMRSASMTPKQQDLWGKLLGPDQPSHERTDISKTTTASFSKAVPSSAQASTGRMRLIDRLKSTEAPARLSRDDSEPEGSDTEISSDDASAAVSSTNRVQSRVPDLRKTTSSFSQSRMGGSQQSQGASGPKFTYGGTRSYLQDINADFEADLLSAPLGSPVLNRAQTANGVDNDTLSEDEQSQTIRSIHELRAAGAKTLFVDEMDALIYDIVKTHDKAGWSRRRAALVTLSTKLEDKTFVDRFHEYNYDDALCDECDAVIKAQGIDTIGDVLLAVCLIRLFSTTPPRQVLPAFLGTGILSWMLEGVDDTCKITRLAKDRKSNMAKTSQADFVSFMSNLGSSEVAKGCPVDTLTRGDVLLACTASILRCIRSSRQIELSVIDGRMLRKLADIALRPLDADSWRSTRALEILEAYSLTTVDVEPAAEVTWNNDLVGKIAVEWPGFSVVQVAEDHERIALLLRLCLNLSNNNPTSCEALGETKVVENLMQIIADCLGQRMSGHAVETSIDDHELDIVLLSLGLMINLVEHSEVVRARIAACTTDGKGLTELVGIFETGQDRAALADSLEQSHANVAHGYLAVLLANLCLDPRCKQQIRGHLADGKMDKLAKAVAEFVQYHEQVDKLALDEVDKAGESVPSWQHFTSRLTAVIDNIN